MPAIPVHGHKAGDLALQTLATLLQARVRGGDMTCRYGADEFLLILPEADVGATHKWAQDLLKEIQALRIVHQDIELHITASAGVAIFTEDDTDIQDVINRANHALYQAQKHNLKSAGIENVATSPASVSECQ